MKTGQKRMQNLKLLRAENINKMNGERRLYKKLGWKGKSIKQIVIKKCSGEIKKACWNLHSVADFLGLWHTQTFFNDKINNLMQATTDNTKRRKKGRTTKMETGFCILSSSLSGWNKYFHLEVENWMKFCQLKASEGSFYFTDSPDEQLRKIWDFPPPQKKRGKMKNIVDW